MMTGNILLFNTLGHYLKFRQPVLEERKVGISIEKKVNFSKILIKICLGKKVKSRSNSF